MARSIPGDILLAGLEAESIVDGPGLRLVVFTQGCPHACPGCHNPETHDPAGGYVSSLADIANQYERNPLLSGITFSGGEPFLQAQPLVALARFVHEKGGDVVTYTGYTYEALLVHSHSRIDWQELLDATDFLIDGPFMQAEMSLELEFRGSRNQRILSRAQRQELRANHRAS